MKYKRFKDSIYGYIKVPFDLCEHFIDTPIFQRLRRIEQTSMRVLYPSAHHDRFSHSLGVYHLGNIAIDQLKINTKNENTNLISEDEWKNYKTSFIIACLLHDCGHSPFSHTFENYYLEDGEIKIAGIIDERRKKIIKNFIVEVSNFESEFKDDFEDFLNSAHEIITCIVILNKFKSQINNLKADIALIIRMILGCSYKNTFNDDKKSIKNCLISLLNGKAIDVDKLDYILRDTWASGVSNVRVDYERLLSSIVIKKINRKKKPKLYYYKHALSVINSVLEGRNFLHKWIFNHHIVIYEQYLMKKIIKEINKKFNDNNSFLHKFFSIDSFNEVIELNNFKFYLPTDDDLVHLFKCYYDDIPEIEELFTRQYSYKALWKTKEEFYLHFEGKSGDELDYIKKEAPEFLKKHKKINDCFILNADIKQKKIERNELFICIDGKIKSFNDIETRQEEKEEHYFILYIPKGALKNKKIIIQTLNKIN